MKRVGSFFALTLAMTITVSAQVFPASPAKPEKLTKSQLRSLIATATTPEQHMRLVQYYEAEAQHYQAESNEHLEMAEQFKKNPITNNSKFVFGTVNHCEYYGQLFKQDAIKMQNLAHMHEQMAEAAGSPQSHENNVEFHTNKIMRLL